MSQKLSASVRIQHDLDAAGAKQFLSAPSARQKQMMKEGLRIRATDAELEALMHGSPFDPGGSTRSASSSKGAGGLLTKLAEVAAGALTDGAGALITVSSTINSSTNITVSIGNITINF